MIVESKIRWRAGRISRRSVKILLQMRIFCFFFSSPANLGIFWVEKVVTRF